MSPNRKLTLMRVAVIAAAFHVSGRTAYDARTAIMEWVIRHAPEGNVDMTVGDLWILTDWEDTPHVK